MQVSPEREKAKELLFAAPQFRDPEHAGFQLWRDVSTRICACHHCKKPIPKRTQRIVMVIRRNQGRKLSNGAWIGKDKLFFHTACIYEALKLKPRDRVRSCVDCDGPATADIPAFMNKRYIWGRICDKCSDSSRWELCRSCGIHYPTFMVQRVIREQNDVRTTTRTCRNCISLRDFYTVADEKKDNRIFSLYRKRIMEKLRAEG